MSKRLKDAAGGFAVAMGIFVGGALAILLIGAAIVSFVDLSWHLPPWKLVRLAIAAGAVIAAWFAIDVWRGKVEL